MTRVSATRKTMLATVRIVVIDTLSLFFLSNRPAKVFALDPMPAAMAPAPPPTGTSAQNHSWQALRRLGENSTSAANRAPPIDGARTQPDERASHSRSSSPFGV